MSWRGNIRTLWEKFVNMSEHEGVVWAANARLGRKNISDGTKVHWGKPKSGKHNCIFSIQVFLKPTCQKYLHRSWVSYSSIGMLKYGKPPGNWETLLTKRVALKSWHTLKALWLVIGRSSLHRAAQMRDWQMKIRVQRLGRSNVPLICWVYLTHVKWPDRNISFWAVKLLFCS